MFRGTRPRVPERCAFAHGLVLRRLLLLLPLLLPSSAAHRTTASPRIFSAALGKKRFQFDTTEKHIAVYHEQGSSVMLVGAENKLYYYNFENSTRHVESFLTKKEARCLKQEDATNYLTLIAKYQGKLLICGTGACNPTCWNWVDGKAEPGISGQSLAPFGLDKNALVLIDGDEIYSTIKKHQTNGRVLRFRRVRGSEELYTSDTVMSNPQFVKAAAIKQDKAFEDKIYYFFREDHPDWMKNPLAPREVSRVAQLCKVKNGGGKACRNGALSWGDPNHPGCPPGEQRVTSYPDPGTWISTSLSQLPSDVAVSFLTSVWLWMPMCLSTMISRCGLAEHTSPTCIFSCH